MLKTYNQLYIDTRNVLRANGVEAANLEARLIVARAAGKTADELVRDFMLYANHPIMDAVAAMLRRRLEGEPLAYILGSWEFYGLDLNVSPDVLIPRPDTEVLVDHAVQTFRGRMNNPRVLDLCCGSGTAMEAAQSLGCRFVGVDKSPEAILTTASRLECSDLTIDCPCTMDETPLEGEYNGHGGMLLLTGFHAAHPSFPKTEQQLDTLESWSVGKITPEGLQVMQRFRRSRKQPELPWFCVLPEGCGDIAVSTVDAAGRKRVYRWKD